MSKHEWGPWIASVHSDFWSLDLPALEQRAYLYLCSFCKGKGYSISILLTASVLHVCPKALKLAIDQLILRSMLTKTHNAGRAYTYKITTRFVNAWGQLPLGMWVTTPNHLGVVTPTTPGQLPLLTGNIEGDTPHLSGDHAGDFITIFKEHFVKWHFSRKAIGRYFIFTKGMHYKALECMRSLHKQFGFTTKEAFDTFLTKCGEYLSHDRDVLSPQKDQRALSPGKWLNDWPEQIRLVGIYIEEQERNIVRMPSEAQ